MSADFLALHSFLHLPFFMCSIYFSTVSFHFITHNLISELICFVFYAWIWYRTLVKILCQQYLEKYVYWEKWWCIQYLFYLLHTHTHTHIQYIYTHTHTHTHTHAHTHIYIFIFYTHTYIHIHTHTHIYIYIYTAGKISIEHVTILLSKYTSKGAVIIHI